MKKGKKSIGLMTFFVSVICLALSFVSFSSDWWANNLIIEMINIPAAVIFGAGYAGGIFSSILTGVIVFMVLWLLFFVVFYIFNAIKTV